MGCGVPGSLVSKLKLRRKFQLKYLSLLLNVCMQDVSLVYIPKGVNPSQFLLKIHRL